MCNHICGQGRNCTCGVETPREKFWYGVLEKSVMIAVGCLIGALLAWRG